MHRQAMLVSLSLSPASNAAKNDKHWAFLEEIDAPQWADLKAEEVLAKAGTIGDDPWFYRSHSHHEVPLTEITGAHAAAIQDSYLNVITPNLERKRNRGTSKAKLAFDGAFSAAEKPTEGRFDESPSRADCHEVSFGDSPRNLIASPVHCKSPEQFFPSRRFISSSLAASSDGSELLGISRLRVNMFESQYVHEKVNQSTGPADEPVPSTPSSAAEEGPAKPWQHTFLAKLNDVSRLRKSVGSALRVKVEDTTDNPGTDQTGVTLPKSRLIHQSVQLDPAAERDTTSLKEDTATDVANGSCQSETVRSASKIGINSSVQAFDDIRKMRKSWGSALRVPRVSDEPESSKLQALEVSPVSDVQSLDETVGDLPSTLLKAIRTSSEEKKQLPSIVRAKERRPAHNRSESVDLVKVERAQERRSAHNRSESVDLVKVERAQERRSAHNRSDSVDLVKVERAKERRAAHNRSESVDLVKLEMDVSSPTVAAAAVAAKKLFRRSVSFDHTPGRGAEPVRSSSSFRSNLSQQRQGSARASPASRLNAPAENLDKASRPVKGGKENTTLQPSTKTTKPNPEASVGSPRMGRQAVTRTSMPSLTFAAHARAVMRGGGGGTILKPSGLNTVVESDRSDSSKAAAASAPRKSAVVLDNGARKKTAGCPATAPNPSKMVSRQSILRSSMPVFPASGAKHPSKPATETVTALKSGPKIGGGDPDLAAMLAEHNRKFRAKPKYEPRIHSVKDIREWEARSGQMFYSLLPWEREKANQEISSAKQQTRQK